ncbi:BrnT family toxin [Candidatus Acetothermia bacterium]|nr:BrnT family toxin [Candidatus Acetothermia bacterium]MBI3460823.1 BrnT family toxin [Candidatus Acetothermia bacterium]MBI3659415.1 BrnT family toxin [Candidatus Acetothermia bacterium]
MRLYEVIWKDRFVVKIAKKHGLNTDEVEQALFSEPYIERAEKGRVKGEDLYIAYGQTRAGRYVVVFFIRKHRAAALVITARDMSPSERRYYHAQKKTS